MSVPFSIHAVQHLLFADFFFFNCNNALLGWPGIEPTYLQGLPVHSFQKKLLENTNKRTGPKWPPKWLGE